MRILLALAAALLAGCPAGQSDDPGGMTMTHPNGIALTPADDWEVTQTAAGFRVATKASRFKRVADTVWVSLESDDKAPGGVWPSLRRLGERVVRYRVDKTDGGSGGAVHVLTAWQSVAGVYVVVQQQTQAEAPAAPDFSLAWQVIERLVLPGPR